MMPKTVSNRIELHRKEWSRCETVFTGNIRRAKADAKRR